MCLFEIASGRIIKKVRRRSVIREGAGFCARCWEGIIAVYVDPDVGEFVLQVGRDRVRITESAVARATSHGGLWTRLEVVNSTTGSGPVARKFTIQKFLLRSKDSPDYEFNASQYDFLMGISESINSGALRAAANSVRDPSSGPWDFIQ